MIEKPRCDLTVFKVHFGLLTLQAYTKGEHVLRFEAIVHNTKQLRCGRVVDRFGEIVGRRAGMVDRVLNPRWTVWMSPSCPRTPAINCRSPPRSALPASAGIDLNKPRVAPP